MSPRANMQSMGRRQYQIVAGLENELRLLKARREKALDKLKRARAYAEKGRAGAAPMGAEALVRQAGNELEGLDDRIAFLRRSLHDLGVMDA